VSRKPWFGALLAIVLLAGPYFYRRYEAKAPRLIVQPARLTLAADGRTRTAFHLSVSDGHEISLAETHVSNSEVQLLQDGAASLIGQLRSPVTPGKQILRLVWKKQTVAIPATFVADFTDSYGDGTPDFLRLHSGEDQQAFQAWFAAIADAQAQRPKDQLPWEIDDCAALLRFSYREALHAHDEPWILAQHLETMAASASVRQYRYPETPLGASLFRVKSGPFVPEDLHDDSFAQFADAKTLMQRNTHFISRDIRVAHVGDLIFFRQLEQNSPYHSMVVVDEAAWVVYHTGPIGKARGEMRRVAMEDLLHHPDVRWRPLPENSNFLGVYRWNILRDGD
jgi:uncharacterized protein YfaT (DUF1175 family)